MAYPVLSAVGQDIEGAETAGSSLQPSQCSRCALNLGTTACISVIHHQQSRQSERIDGCR